LIVEPLENLPMSPRRSAAAVVDQPAPEMISDPTEALKSRANQIFRQALATYREAVFSAARSDGQLPATKLDAVVEACHVAGIPVEQFGDDVDTTRRHQHQRENISSMEAKHGPNTEEATRLAKEIEALQVELAEKKQRHRSVGESFIRGMAETMRGLNELEIRNPHLFMDAASVTPDVVRKKLTTRAFFSR
jgi:hypothetical protein